MTRPPRRIRGPPTPDHLGFLAVDKPSGITSHDAVAKVRRISGMRKVGHAGTLDPMATGLLVVALGPATRLIRYVQAGRKRYTAEVVFGIATDSLDADGEEVFREPMPIDEDTLRAALPSFVGEIQQVPPMVSALKRGGVRLHELARQGIEVEREPRPVTIDRIDLASFTPGEFPTATLDVTCGAGTYIRVLADDVARALGGRAHLTALRRTAIGPIDVARASTLEQLEATGVGPALIAPSEALAELPGIEVEGDEAEGVPHGRPIERAAEPGRYRILDVEGALLAVYRSEGSRLVPETVLPA